MIVSSSQDQKKRDRLREIDVLLKKQDRKGKIEGKKRDKLREIDVLVSTQGCNVSYNKSDY